MEPRDFTAEEITEIHQYIEVNVPYSILQSIFPITENPVEKVRVFTLMYRLINSASNYVTSKDTKDKLNEILKEAKDVYVLLYQASLIKASGNINWGAHRNDKKIRYILMDYNNTLIINKIIDLFLIFSEKQTFYDTNKVVGIVLDGSKEAEDLVNNVLN